MKGLWISILVGAVVLVASVFSSSWQEENLDESVRDLVLSSAPASSSAELEKKTSASYRVSRVVDGDTIIVDLGGRETTLRMIGVNTPEVVDPRKPVECFGREASSRTKELLTGQRVNLGFDDTQGRWDKYNRLLAYVYREDGLFINKRLIEDGFAHEYTYNSPYIYQSDFDAAESNARQNQLGLWAPGVCEEYRANQEALGANSLVQANGQEYVCSSNSYDCKDFTSQSAAQDLYVLCGGSVRDIHWLDADKDGRACESLPNI